MIKIILLSAMRHHLFHFLRVLVLFHTSTLFCQSSSAQYYYHDIALTYQNLQQQQLLMSQSGLLELVKLQQLNRHRKYVQQSEYVSMKSTEQIPQKQSVFSTAVLYQHQAQLNYSHRMILMADLLVEQH